MPLTSKITPYDARWPQMYASTADWLRPIFGRSLIDIQHVGSTAVPGLAAKPEIDVLVVVSDTADVERWAAALAEREFSRGGDLSPGHLFFKRNEHGVRTHKLHVCVPDHPTALKMLKFRDHLRRSPGDRERYAALKLALEAENTGGIGEYLEKKAPFIDSIVDRSTDV
jgi:GrpB-like predicted nucleotidyltransferase (UPF0157 family)